MELIHHAACTGCIGGAITCRTIGTSDVDRTTPARPHCSFDDNDGDEDWPGYLCVRIHVGGRPPDEFSEGIETSFTGCMARMQLNSVDLLSFAPRDGGHKCQMSKPPSLTLHESAKAFIPFSFLPFSSNARVQFCGTCYS
ncbi:hypothetical protein OSTOST_18739 [Ostertagia ostertagi]